MSNALSRRTILRGLGCAVALPVLDAMGPVASAAPVVGGTAKGAAAAPVRMAFMFIPNGVNFQDWTPSGEGTNWQLSNTLKPLAKVKDDIMVLSGLTLDNARAKGDGPGDHARSAAAFLTGAHPVKTSGKDIKLGVSVDQVAAQKVGDRTRFPSLELGLDKGQLAGNCDSGYSCAYVSNISWRSDTTPMPKEMDPALLFDRLFGNGTPSQRDENLQKRLRYRKSILDFVNEDSKRLQRKLGATDQQKLDEFTTSIREIEKRVDMARSAEAGKPAALPKIDRPDGVPDNMEEHMRLMVDLLVLALQTDMTRIATVMVARDGSNRRYKELGVSEGHHSLSHHGGNQDKIEQIRKIDQFHMAQLAYFVERLKSVKEGAGTLLDNTMLMCGSGISDGNRHNHENLPIVLAGRGGGLIKPGRHVTYPRNTPLCNLYLSMLNAMGVKDQSFADSTGTLTQLS